MLYKLKPYNLGRSILYSLFSVILYSTIIDEREQYGNINLFVCDYIEANNGVIYLDKIRALGCDFINH